MTIDSIGELDDRSVVLAVQYLTEDLSSGNPVLVRTEAEARLVISALLAKARVADTDAGQLLPGEPAAIAAARRALEAAAGDKDTRESASEILADPPRDEQMSVEAVLASTAVLALLISWLQTKVEFRVHRKDGKTEVEFAIGKQAADAQVIRAIAATFSSILGIPVGKAPRDIDSPLSSELRIRCQRIDGLWVSASVAGHGQPALLRPFREQVPPPRHVERWPVGPRPEDAAGPDSRSPADRQPCPQYRREDAQPGLQAVEFCWPGSPRSFLLRSPDSPGDELTQDLESPTGFHDRHRTGQQPGTRLCRDPAGSATDRAELENRRADAYGNGPYRQRKYSAGSVIV